VKQINPLALATWREQHMVSNLTLPEAGAIVSKWKTKIDCNLIFLQQLNMAG